MAPYVPEEVDVFTVPHSRMKDLVNDYVQMIEKTNFSSVADLELLLDSLQRTFAEFKMHEQIENRLIMKRLKNKLKKLSIRNTLVCNCHKDSHLTDMMVLVREGFAKKTAQDRLNYSLQLRKALEDFTDDFLPHMREEEEVFQPMLLQYFSYEELCDLKVKVIERHLQGDTAVDAVEKGLLEDEEKKRGNVSGSDSEEEEVANSAENASFSSLPPEVVQKIFSYLNPKQLLACSGVCHNWARMARVPSLWRELHPVKWVKGEWDVVLSRLEDNDEEPYENSDDNMVVIDDDADVDEAEDSEGDLDASDITRQIHREARILLALIKYLLPSVGEGVKALNLQNSRALTNGLLQKMLRMLPNLEYLNVSQTRTSDAGLKRLGIDRCGSKLHHLNLAGCKNITDATLVRLAGALSGSSLPSCAQTDFVTGTTCHCLQYRAEVDGVDRFCRTEPYRTGHIHSFRDFVMSKDQQNTLDNERTFNTSAVNDAHSKEACWPHFNNSSQSVKTQAQTLYTACHSSCQNQQDGAEPDPVEDCARAKYAGLVPRGGQLVSGVAPSDGVADSHADGGWGETETREEEYGAMVTGNGNTPREQCKLKYLNLSGCCQLTDIGVAALAGVGQLNQLTYLDLSGCPALTGMALTTFVSLCPTLDHETFYYCDNIMDGPYPDTASGCQNLECDSRACCRKGH